MIMVSDTIEEGELPMIEDSVVIKKGEIDDTEYTVVVTIYQFALLIYPKTFNSKSTILSNSLTSWIEVTV